MEIGDTLQVPLWVKVLFSIFGIPEILASAVYFGLVLLPILVISIPLKLLVSIIGFILSAQILGWTSVRLRKNTLYIFLATVLVEIASLAWSLLNDVRIQPVSLAGVVVFGILSYVLYMRRASLSGNVNVILVSFYLICVAISFGYLFLKPSDYLQSFTQNFGNSNPVPSQSSSSPIQQIIPQTQTALGTENWQQYRSDTYKFDVKYPSGWLKLETSEEKFANNNPSKDYYEILFYNVSSTPLISAALKNNALLKEPEYDYPAIGIFVFGSVKDLESFIAQRVSSGFGIKKKIGSLTIGGENAVQYSSTVTFGTVSFTDTDIFLVHNNNGYLIVFDSKNGPDSETSSRFLGSMKLN